MTDVTDNSALTPKMGRAERFDYQRAAFWVAIVMGAAGAGVTVAAGPAVGPVGAVLLIGVATTAIVFLMWLMGLGKRVGLYPAKGATEAASFAVSRSEFGLIEALDEPAFVAEHGATPVVANASYMAAASSAGALGESERPPTMDRLFGADPVVAAPMYRLANAAKRGQTRREELPATAIGRGALKRYEASVAPMPGGRTLWRLRDLGGPSGGTDVAPADPRKVFIDEAPIGFFSARPDGSILYMNQSLRAVLGVGDDMSDLKLRDIMKDDPQRFLRRDRMSFGATRAEITLRARDGMETPAVTLTSWPASDGDGGSRTIVFFHGREAPADETIGPQRIASGPIDGFFENAPFGAAVLDSADPAQASILDSNPALMEMAQGRAAPGAGFADLFDASEGPAELAKKLRAASQAPVELTLATTPPSAAHVHLARGPDGKGLAFVVNVSEQREIEQRLAQSEKMREIGTLA
jgi:two-component system cell cycle sensor histidine kinase/response regulator CckA